MKSTGVSRKLDDMGRIVIPSELRKSLGISTGTSIEIFVDEDKITLRKFTSNRSCVVTGDVLPENREYPGGIILSPRGAEILVEHILG